MQFLPGSRNLRRYVKEGDFDEDGRISYGDFLKLIDGVDKVRRDARARLGPHASPGPRRSSRASSTSPTAP